MFSFFPRRIYASGCVRATDWGAYSLLDFDLNSQLVISGRDRDVRSRWLLSYNDLTVTLALSGESDRADISGRLPIAPGKKRSKETQLQGNEETLYTSLIHPIGGRCTRSITKV